MQKLRDAAEQESCCGQNAIMERKVIAKSESSTVAIATDMQRYDYSLEKDKRTLETNHKSNGSTIKQYSGIENGNGASSKRSKLY